MFRVAALAACFLVIATVASAQDAPKPSPTPTPSPTPSWKISGLVFGDLYYLQSPFTAFDQQHGLWLRRGFFTYDHTFSPTVTTRLRFEVNSNGKMEGGLLTPYVKDAYVRWTFFQRQTVTVGIQPTLTFNFIEAVWGLRHIEKTPLDLYRTDSSRDTGVTLAGPLNGAQTLLYQVQYGTDSNNTAETNRFKGYRAAARYETNPGFSIEGMVGQSNRAGDADRTTAQIFAGYRQPRWRAGFQYSNQTRKAAGLSDVDTDIEIMSGFGVFDVKPQKFSVFARVDRFNDPCADCPAIDYLPIDGRQPFTLTLAGVEYYVHPSVRFSPNVEYVAYGDPPDGSDKPVRASAAARLTFYWVW